MHNHARLTYGICTCLFLAAAQSAVAESSAAAGPSGAGEGAAAGEAVEGGEASSGAAGGKAASRRFTKPASTATAAGALYQEIKKGRIKIEGATDPSIPDD